MEKTLAIFSFSLLVFLSLFFFSCSESKPIDISGITKIYPIENKNTYYDDTLTIYGEFLGSPQDSSYVIFNDTLKILSSDCLGWTESKISIKVPQLPTNSTCYVVIKGEKINISAETYYFNVLVQPLPPFSKSTVESGSFLMGGNFGFSDELPTHKVSITNKLEVSSTEINQRIYRLAMDENPSEVLLDELPVYNISWIEAIKFCNKISEIYSLQAAYKIMQNNYVSWDTTANGWRLPTEAEWEYISQIDTNNFNLNEYAWYSYNSGLHPQPCGKLKSTRNNIYDLLGNVSEWCWDYYDENYYKYSPEINPKGPIDGKERVARGGSCYDGKAFVRIQKRKNPSAINFIGVRLVRTIK